MSADFKLLMLGAMYENGGNTTHRFLDGHPQMFVYPFESQLGTKLVTDHLSSVFPVKYRWPVFALSATAEQDYLAIIDEECKVRAKTPNVSKFRHMPFEFSDDERLSVYIKHVRSTERSRANNVAAFFQATFESWRDYKQTGKEVFYVGYSPIIGVDADKIFADLPQAHFLHVVRNPWSAYADTKKRPVPLSLDQYMLGWNLNQYYALLFSKRYSERFHVLRLEDVIADPFAVLGAFCKKLGLQQTDTLKKPTWNGNVLEQIYPWGTIAKATPEANRATADELSPQEKQAIKEATWQYLDEFNYADFLKEKIALRV